MNNTRMIEAAFEQSLPMLLSQALDQVMPAYRALFAEHGLTEQQWRVLRVLWEQRQLPSVEVSRRTLLPTNSLVGVLERLEKRGLIARERSDQDRRIVMTTLTAAGKQLGEAVWPGLAEIQNEIAVRLTPAEWDTLRELLVLASGEKKR